MPRLRLRSRSRSRLRLRSNRIGSGGLHWEGASAALFNRRRRRPLAGRRLCWQPKHIKWRPFWPSQLLNYRPTTADLNGRTADGERLRRPRCCSLRGADARNDGRRIGLLCLHFWPSAAAAEAEAYKQLARSVQVRLVRPTLNGLPRWQLPTQERRCCCRTVRPLV